MFIMQLAAEDARHLANEFQLHEYDITDDGDIKRGRLTPELLQDLDTGRVCRPY